MTVKEENVTNLTRRGLTVYKENPFAGTLVVPTKTKKYSNTSGEKVMLVSQETGEIKPAGFWTSKKVDEEQFVKLFAKGVKAFADLKNPGAKVFEILYKQMQENMNKDIVFLSFSLIEEEESISIATYNRGIKELIDKKFIAPRAGSVGWYFVNPQYVWNGDRLVFAEEYVKVKNNSANLDNKTIDMFEEES